MVCYQHLSVSPGCLDFSEVRLCPGTSEAPGREAERFVASPTCSDLQALLSDSFPNDWHDDHVMLMITSPTCCRLLIHNACSFRSCFIFIKLNTLSASDNWPLKMLVKTNCVNLYVKPKLADTLCLCSVNAVLSAILLRWIV